MKERWGGVSPAPLPLMANHSYLNFAANGSAAELVPYKITVQHTRKTPVFHQNTEATSQPGDFASSTLTATGACVSTTSPCVGDSGRCLFRHVLLDRYGLPVPLTALKQPSGGLIETDCGHEISLDSSGLLGLSHRIQERVYSHADGSQEHASILD